MTAMTQDEIITNTKTVIQGLEALKTENHSILSGLLSSLTIVREAAKGDANTKLMEEKASIIQKSIESIELGLGEAQVGIHTFSNPHSCSSTSVNILTFYSFLSLSMF